MALSQISKVKSQKWSHFPWMVFRSIVGTERETERRAEVIALRSVSRSVLKILP